MRSVAPVSMMCLSLNGVISYWQMNGEEEEVAVDQVEGVEEAEVEQCSVGVLAEVPRPMMQLIRMGSL